MIFFLSITTALVQYRCEFLSNCFATNLSENKCIPLSLFYADSWNFLANPFVKKKISHQCDLKVNDYLFTNSCVQVSCTKCISDFHVRAYFHVRVRMGGVWVKTEEWGPIGSGLNDNAEICCGS